MLTIDMIFFFLEDARGSAAELLNGDVQKEANGTPAGGIFLRDNPKRQSYKKKSVWRQSLTNSLSRIGSRMRRKPAKLQRLQSTLDLDKLAQNELELKANLYWHIGTPIKRWKVEGQVPVKLVLQLLKTFCLIVQVICSLAVYNGNVTVCVENCVASGRK